ncbi:SH3 domain-containing protein [Leptospira sp. WS39.C2]
MTFQFLQLVFCFVTILFFTIDCNQNDNDRVVIAKNGLFVRVEPLTNAKVMTRLPSGKYVSIVSESKEPILELSGRKGNFVKIQFEQNEQIAEGWAFSGFLYKYQIGYPTKEDTLDWETYLRETNWTHNPQKISNVVNSNAIRFFTPAHANSVKSKSPNATDFDQKGSYWIEDYERKIDLAIYKDGTEEKIDATCKVLTLEPKFEEDYTRVLNCMYDFTLVPYMIYFDQNSTIPVNPPDNGFWTSLQKKINLLFKNR